MESHPGRFSRWRNNFVASNFTLQYDLRDKTRTPPNPGAYFGGSLGLWSPFWPEKYENSQQKRVLNIFVILGGHGVYNGQSRIDFTKINLITINQNYELFSDNLEIIGWGI